MRPSTSAAAVLGAGFAMVNATLAGYTGDQFAA
jgi:hypothetical protein